MKYRLIQRKNPNDRDAAPKWYATPMNETPEDVKTMTSSATEYTTTAAIELESALELFGEYAKKKLLNGESIRIGNLGTLRLTFRSEGVDDIRKFKSHLMIHDARMLFTPTKEFREDVINKLSYENNGVLADGIEYASLQSYYKAMGYDTDEDPDDGNDPSEEDGPQVQ